MKELSATTRTAFATCRDGDSITRPLAWQSARVAVRSGVLGIVHHPKERMRSEKVIFNIETRFPSLPPVRGEQTLPLRPGLDALRIV
jgi:hypothetical protein